MSHNKKNDRHGHDSQHNHSKKKAGIHKDWRTWTAVILMLVAMLAYVMSEDEAIVPGGGQQEAMEAAE